MNQKQNKEIETTKTRQPSCKDKYQHWDELSKSSLHCIR